MWGKQFVRAAPHEFLIVGAIAPIAHTESAPVRLARGVTCDVG